MRQKRAFCLMRWHWRSAVALAFLRLLQGSETLRNEYATLKKRLTEKYPHDRLGYRLEKGVFIERCLRENTAENAVAPDPR